jgi:hypothetical protein
MLTFDKNISTVTIIKLKVLVLKEKLEKWDYILTENNKLDQNQTFT